MNTSRKQSRPLTESTRTLAARKKCNITDIKLNEYINIEIRFSQQKFAIKISKMATILMQ